MRMHSARLMGLIGLDAVLGSVHESEQATYYQALASTAGKIILSLSSAAYEESL